VALLIHLDLSPPQELLPLTPVTIDRVKYHAAVRDPKVSLLVLGDGTRSTLI
jgi:hypothetical protein